ncbi:MAG: beta-propeller domain-containing protein [Clostridia bacterium]|nr:beta-propeller domain-containing protein [Clostridia bacterium]
MKVSKRIVILVLMAMLAFALMLSATSCGGSTNNTAEDNGNNGTETNVQEVGVDEGDIVKMKGNYIFKAQRDGVTVSKVENGYLSLVSRYALINVTPKELFVTDDKLVVISSFGVENSRTSIHVFGLSEGMDTALLYSAEINANFYSSRLYKNRNLLYVFAQRKNESRYFDGTLGTSGYLENGELKEAYTENVSYSDVIGDKFTVSYSSSFSFFIKIDLSALDSTASCYTNCAVYDVYMSENAIYGLYNYSINEKLDDVRNTGCGARVYTAYKVTKYVYLFRLDNMTLRETGHVTFENYVIKDRLSLKEYGEKLYVAAEKTDGSGSTVAALDRNMHYINQLEKIAPRENVKSVSYDEVDGRLYCYIVTYRNVDPLFKVDVTDANDMFVVGAVKVTGYSGYTYSVSDELLIGVGYGGTEQSANTRELQVGLYDVKSDIPQLINSFSVPDFSYAEALENIHAFCVDGRAMIFGFSATRASGYDRRQGAYIFRIVEKNNENGGEELPIAQKYSLTPLAYLSDFKDGYVSDDKFAEYRFINRILIDDSFIYTVSDAYIKSYLISELEEGKRVPFDSLKTVVNVNYSETDKAGGNYGFSYSGFPEGDAKSTYRYELASELGYEYERADNVEAAGDKVRLAPYTVKSDYYEVPDEVKTPTHKVELLFHSTHTPDKIYIIADYFSVGSRFKVIFKKGDKEIYSAGGSGNLSKEELAVFKATGRIYLGENLSSLGDFDRVYIEFYGSALIDEVVALDADGNAIEMFVIASSALSSGGTEELKGGAQTVYFAGLVDYWKNINSENSDDE